MSERPVVIVSNRGPVSFRHEGGRLEARRGAGGLISGVGPVVAGTDAVWVAAAMSDADREAAAGGVIEAEGYRFRALDIDPMTYRAAYDVISNATLWFVHHGLFERAHRPRYDDRWWEAWAAYRTVNDAFARAAAEVAPEGATVLVQDYHLALVGPALRAARDDLRLVHFSHTPFAGPDDLRLLPTEAAREMLVGLASHHACGFHTQRWAASFRLSCEANGVEPPETFVSPLPIDTDRVLETAGSEACEQSLASLEAQLDGRKLIARSDRLELSKNVLRGFWAFDALLEAEPQWRERVVFGAFVYPSREGLPEYLAYRQEVETLAHRVNDRWATADWTPVLLDVTDDYARSIAALRRYDVLLVNAVRDGLNLVAKEGAVVNERDGVLVLSPETGAHEELAGAYLETHPLDIVETARVLGEALSMPDDVRRKQAEARRTIVSARGPADWLADLLSAAG